MADDAGALLVRTGLISDQALLAARKACAQSGGTIGEQLVLAGAVTDEALTEFYRARLLVPRVNPNTLARLGPAVVEAIPGELAVEFRAVPVSLDREGNLTVAMSDPSDRHAVDELGFFTGKYVVRAVATQMQVAWCLAHYYGHITELGQRLLKPSANGAAAIAPASNGAPAAVPRVRGFTGRIEASRHKVLAPVFGEPVKETPRPSDKLLTPTKDDVARVVAASASAVIQNRAPVAPPKPLPPPPPPAAEPAPEAELEIEAEPEVEVEAAPEPAPPQVSEPYAQVHVSLLQGDEKTPAKGVPKRRPQQQPDPPELAARGGEIEAHEPGRPKGMIDGEMPAVVVALEDEDGEQSEAVEMRPVDDEEFDAAEWAARRDSVDRMATEPEPSRAPAPPEAIADDAAVVHDIASGTESRPILLTAPRRTLKETVPDTDDDDEPVVLLDRKKPDTDPAPTAPASSIADAIVRAAGKPRRTAKHTQIGMGLPAVVPKPSSQFQPAAPEPIAESQKTDPVAAPPLMEAPRGHRTEPAGSPRPWSAATPADGVPKLVDEKHSDASTRPHHASSPPHNIDDGWGPPGTTIPPPFLGVAAGAEWTGPKAQVPIDEGDDEGDEPAPQLLVVAPAPPPSEPPPPPSASAPRLDPMATARELERASTRLVELLRGLDTVGSRDQTIEALIAYLAENHDRVAFFAVQKGTLSPFLQRPPAKGKPVSLPLDQPSTLQDAVGTRLPYRGAVADDTTRKFLQDVFGVPPAEILILPIAVRDRVVAVLYGDGRRGHTFDEHFAIAGRAAGLALERILQAKRAQTER
jgi:hypothetical protein